MCSMGVHGTSETLAEMSAPDDRSLRLAQYGLSMAGTLTPEAVAEFQQNQVTHCDLEANLAPEYCDALNGAAERRMRYRRSPG